MKKLLFLTFVIPFISVTAANRISKFEQDQIDKAIAESLKTPAQDEARRAKLRAEEQRQLQQAIKESLKEKEREDARRANERRTQREADERRRAQERRDQERRDREQRELERRRAEEQREQADRLQQALLARQAQAKRTQLNSTASHPNTTEAQPNTTATQNNPVPVAVQQPAHVHPAPVQVVVQPNNEPREIERHVELLMHPTNVNIKLKPTVQSTTHKERIKKAIARIIGGATLGCLSGAVLGILKKQMIEDQFGEGQKNFNPTTYCMKWGTGAGALVGLVFAAAQWM